MAGLAGEGAVLTAPDFRYDLTAVRTMCMAIFDSLTRRSEAHTREWFHAKVAALASRAILARASGMIGASPLRPKLRAFRCLHPNAGPAV